MGDGSWDTRRGYLIVEWEIAACGGAVGGRWVTLIGEMERGTLSMVRGIVDAWNELGGKCFAEDGRRACFTMAEHFEECAYYGVFSGGRGECGCSVEDMLAEGQVCELCEKTTMENWVFVPQAKFAGVCPLGAGHWWKGVTDATTSWGEHASWADALWRVDCVGTLSLCELCVASHAAVRDGTRT
jgi:hypothetical protein